MALNSLLQHCEFSARGRNSGQGETCRRKAAIRHIYATTTEPPARGWFVAGIVGFFLTHASFPITLKSRFVRIRFNQEEFLV